MYAIRSYYDIIFRDLVSEDGSFHAPEIVPHNGFDIKTIKELFHKNRLEADLFRVLHIRWL